MILKKANITINLQEVEDMLDNKKICFICGVEKREEKDVEILKEDLQKIVNRVIKEKQSILIYDNGSYINTVLEKICDKHNIELIKITSQDEKGEGLIYGNDKYEVSKNLSKYFSNKDSDIYVIGGSLFASDLLVNLENEKVNIIYESRIEGAGKEYEERRNNKERENKEGLLETRGRKK